MKNTRQKQIMNLLLKDGQVGTGDLMERFGVSIETIRRDYNELEREGALKKTYGGAVLAANSRGITEVADWQERMRVSTREKALIGRKAAEYIPDGCVLATEVGTTVFELARHLEHKNNLTVLTNDLYVAQELFRNRTNRVYLAGGFLTSPYYTAGPLSRRAIEEFASIDVFIISTEGATLAEGLTTPNAEVNDLKRLYLQKAAKTIAVIDHTKFGRKAIFHTCDFSAVDLLITDDRAPLPMLRKIREKGVEVVVVSEGAPMAAE